MRHTSCQRLSDAQVAQLEAHRKTLGLTQRALLQKFEEALNKDGCIHTPAAGKMRLDRVFNRRMRRPMSEDTKSALAAALDWSVPQLESAIGPGSGDMRRSRATKAPGRAVSGCARDLLDVTRRLQIIQQKLQALARKDRNPARRHHDFR